MEKFILKYKKEILIGISVLLNVILLIALMSRISTTSIDGPNNSNNSTSSTTAISYTFSVFSYGEQDPSLIKDFVDSLPYVSPLFNINYNSVENKMIVTSGVYTTPELEAKIHQFLFDFPNVNYDEYVWEFQGIEDTYPQIQ